MTDYDKAEQIKALIQELLAAAGFQVRVEYEDSLLKGLVFNINSRDSRSLIGRQGMTLHSLEILVHALAARRFKGESFHFSLDVDDYKRKRDWALKEMAREAVDSIKRTGKAVTLEPMPNYERRIVHSYLQDNHPEVKSSSEGADPNRRIIISPARSSDSML